MENVQHNFQRINGENFELSKMCVYLEQWENEK